MEEPAPELNNQPTASTADLPNQDESGPVNEDFSQLFIDYDAADEDGAGGI